MRFRDSKTGRDFFKKCRCRFSVPGQARELTFSCFRHFPLLNRDRTRAWFIEALDELRNVFKMDLWAYVIMPEHVHLLVLPRDSEAQVGAFQGKVKERVARKAIAFLSTSAPEWLQRLRVQEGQRVRHRFWQPGGGYDRNVVELETAHQMMNYIHMNPVRRGLAERAVDWPWSSARWYAGDKSGPIQMDASLPMAMPNE